MAGGDSQGPPCKRTVRCNCRAKGTPEHLSELTWHSSIIVLSIVILKKLVMTDFPERIEEETDSGHTRRPVFATTHWVGRPGRRRHRDNMRPQELPISKQKSLVVRRF